MSQPVWKLIANLGDVNPIDHGGYFVYRDETGVYPEEAEVLVSPDSDDAPEGWQVYRFSLDRCTFIDGVLSDNEYHPECEAWFAGTFDGLEVHTMGEDRDLIADICSDNPIHRAIAYREIGEYHGFINLDEYPLTFTDRAEVEARYSDHAEA